MMLLSSNKLKLDIALAMAGCHQPQWKRGRDSVIFLSSIGTKVLSINLSLKLRLITAVAAGADVCFSIS